MKTSILITSLALAIGLPAVAMALEGARAEQWAGVPTSFMTLDSNKNGTTSQKEILNGEDHVIVKKTAFEGLSGGGQIRDDGRLISTIGETYLPAAKADCAASSPCTTATFTPNGKIETKGTSVTFSQEPNTGNVTSTIRTSDDVTQLPAHKVDLGPDDWRPTDQRDH